MPNWCNNNITITGPADKIRAMYDQAVSDADDETGLLDSMVPMPKELHETSSPSEGPNWYDWRVNNWGTKWEVSSEGLEFEDLGNGTASISGWFDSAWAPPIQCYNTFLENNHDFTIESSYYEPGMDFAGFYSNGIEDYCDSLHDEYKLPEDQRSELFKRLDEEWDLSNQFEQWDDEDEEMVIDDEA